jgi:hypothetical protein
VVTTCNNCSNYGVSVRPRLTLRPEQIASCAGTYLIVGNGDSRQVSLPATWSHPGPLRIIVDHSLHVLC